MSESLTQRVGRLVAGGFNALVDAVENAAPEAVMEQAIREVESAISEVRNELGTVEAQRHLTAKRLAEDSARHDALGEQARLALDEDRNDLAETAVARQIDLEAQIPVLEARLADLADEKKRLEGYIEALRAKQREMTEALDGYRESHRAAGVSGKPEAGQPSASRADDRAERAATAFDRVFRRETGIAGTSSATAAEGAKLAELEELSRKNRVAERLAQLKSGG